jgi:hypothetical protein
MSQQWNTPSPGGTGTVQNYLIPAILSLFCCWPLAIVAIIFAAQVNGKVAAGDMAGAMDSAKKAKMFSFISIGLGLVLILCYIVFIVFIGGMSALSR